MQYLELTRINGCDESLLIDNCQPFNIISDLLSIDKKTLIMDLGSANKANLGFFSEYSCKIYIENIYELIIDAIKENEKCDNDQNPDFNSLYFCKQPTKVDVILCWELLNYIPIKFLPGFIKSLSRFMKPGGNLHCFIATQAFMSTQALEYQIINDKTMQREEFVSEQRMKSPRYNQMALYKLMPDFTVIKSVLHRNGMQEYLFKYNPG